VLISIDRRLVLVSTPKCGSTSLEAALARHMPMHLSGAQSLKHATLGDFNRHLRPFLAEKGFEGFESVAAVREPIDWLMSWWRYRTRDGIRGHPHYTGDMTFEEFVRACLSPDPPAYARFPNPHPARFLVDGDDTVDHLFRYEHLDRMVAWLSDRLGVELSLPKRNVSRTPRVEVAPALVDELRSVFAEDYDLWSRAT
jgi:hypothetical protein